MYWELKCPYCGKEIDLDFTDHNLYDEETFQMECPECEMIINVTPSVSIDIKLDKCDCQLENHEWQPSITNPRCMTEMVCKHCGERRKPTDEEKTKYNIPSVDDFIKELESENKNLNQGK